MSVTSSKDEGEHIFLPLRAYPQSNFRVCLLCGEPGWVVDDSPTNTQKGAMSGTAEEAAPAPG